MRSTSMDDKIIPLPERDEIGPASGLFVSPPGPEADLFTEVGGRPLWWQDDAGRKHACEGVEIQPDGIAVWTLCRRDVAPSVVFHPEARDRLTCEGCIAVAVDRKNRQEFEVIVGPTLMVPGPANAG
jgi:hypothetical protein